MLVMNFRSIRKTDVPTAGGKGANLGEMSAAGIPVPPGFVVTAEAYRLFIKENRLEKAFADELAAAGNDEEKLLAAAARLRAMIREGRLPSETETAVREQYAALAREAGSSPLRVAVRSSATAEDLPDASFAGQQETYLNVQGIDEVLSQIINCYASLWGGRAVCYRQNQGYDQNSVALAVVVQRMIESEKAGVLFTANPVNGSRDEMQLNASWGLGESVVSGRVTADSVLCTKDGTVKAYTVGDKKTEIVYAERNAGEPAPAQGREAGELQERLRTDLIISGQASTKEITVSADRRVAHCLSGEEIAALCAEGARIEAHYGMPMDIEWAVAGGRIYILQARAVTTLRDSAAEEADAALIQSYIKSSRISGVLKSNMAFQLEKMPYAYRPLDYDFIMKINSQKARIFHENGIIITSDPQIDDDGIMTLPDPSKKISKNIFRLPGTIRMIRDYDYCAEQCGRFMPKHTAAVEEIKKTDFSAMTVAACGDFLARVYELTGTICYDRFKFALFPSALGQSLTRAVRRVDKHYTSYDLYWGLDNRTAVVTRGVVSLADEIYKDADARAAVLAGIKYDALREQFPALAPLFDAFLDKNGYKSDFNCYCVEAKTLKEDPDRLLNILRPFMAETPSSSEARADGFSRSGRDGNTEAEESAKDFDTLMAQLQQIYGKKYPALERRIQNFRTFHLVREESQYLWETLFYYVRRCLERLNLLLLNDADHIRGIDNLFYTELIEACGRGALSDADREKIARRDKKHPLSQRVWDASKLLVFDASGDTLKGVSGSSGTAVGEARIIKSPAEFYKMQKGDILVCELTDPEWTPLFKLASAVVADTGSALSHAAIVAREFGIPAVLGVGFATTKFKDGDRIRVDGDKGEVSAC